MKKEVQIGEKTKDGAREGSETEEGQSRLERKMAERQRTRASGGASERACRGRRGTWDERKDEEETCAGGAARSRTENGEHEGGEALET